MSYILVSLYTLFHRLVCEEAIGVASSVNVEADELTFVIETIDGRRANTVRVVDRLPFGMT